MDGGQVGRGVCALAGICARVVRRQPALRQRLHCSNCAQWRNTVKQLKANLTDFGNRFSQGVPPLRQRLRANHQILKGTQLLGHSIQDVNGGAR